MSTPMLPTTFLTPKQCADVLQVSPATIRNMIKRGELDALQLKGGRGVYRIPVASLNALMGKDLPSQIESRSVFKNPLKP